MTTKCKSIDEALKFIARDVERVKKAAKKAAKRSADVTVKYIQENTVPVKTGRLRASGHVRESDEGVGVVFDTPYAAIVEHGTGSREPRHYVLRAQPVLERSLEEFLVEEVEALKNEGT